MPPISILLDGSLPSYVDQHVLWSTLLLVRTERKFFGRRYGPERGNEPERGYGPERQFNLQWLGYQLILAAVGAAFFDDVYMGATLKLYPYEAGMLIQGTGLLLREIESPGLKITGLFLFWAGFGVCVVTMAAILLLP